MGKIKNFIKKFFLINDTPHKVAAGAALGIFLGIIPGAGLLATLILSGLFRFNRLAALAGAGVMNMWSTFLILPPAAYAGGLIFGVKYDEIKTCFADTSQLGLKYFLGDTAFLGMTLPLICGFLVVAGAIALSAYFGLLYILCKRKKYCEREHLLMK